MENIKYLILGNGYLGNKFNNFLENSILSKIRVTNSEEVQEEIKKYNPDFVINCIGKTGRPNIDWCESHKAETLFSNVTVPALILDACQKLDKKMVHIGSGCIYGGDNHGNGFSEEDEPNFFGSFYSRTKIFSEKILKELDILQLRIRMPTDSIPNERNLITKILKYDKIINTPNSITIIEDLLAAAKKLMDKDAKGIFNIVNPGAETHKELIDLYNEFSNKKKEFEVISIDQLDSSLKARRSNCILSTKKLEQQGIFMKPVNEALRETIQKYTKSD